MELINVEEVFCKDCEFKDQCSTIFCDVHNMPRVILKNTEGDKWKRIYALDSSHVSMTCSICNKRYIHHNSYGTAYFCPNCGARMVKYE